MLKSCELVNVFINARARIENPEHWTRGVMRNGDRLCLVGAFLSQDARQGEQVASLDKQEVFKLLAELVVPRISAAPGREPATLSCYMRNGAYTTIIAWFNDDMRTTHADVLAVLDEAIAIA